MAKAQQEIVREGYQVLVDALGAVDALRFIQYFSPGQGNYTEDRHTWLNTMSLNDILSQMQQRKDGDRDAEEYDEIID